MFRRFIDLSLSENVPDHSSIWCFRQLLNTEQLLEPLLEQINTHLEQNSITVLCSVALLQSSLLQFQYKPCRLVLISQIQWFFLRHHGCAYRRRAVRQSKIHQLQSAPPARGGQIEGVIILKFSV